MAGKRVDRRVGRTKRHLKEALLELIQERDYDRITIRDITERADVGRSTFYSHFDSKDDLLFSGFDRWLLSIAENAPAPGGAGPSGREGSEGFRFSLPLLEHIRSQKRFFEATIARGSNAEIRDRTMAMLVERIEREMERMRLAAAERSGVAPGAGLHAEPSRKARAHAVAGAFLALVSWWLRDGERLSPEAVDRVFQDLVGGAASGRPSLPLSASR